jgi:predicted Rdx family selenoprotein
MGRNEEMETDDKLAFTRRRKGGVPNPRDAGFKIRCCVFHVAVRYGPHPEAALKQAISQP